MDIEQIRKQSKDIIELATAARFDDEVARVQSEVRHFSDSIGRWVEDQTRAARADGRDSLHADDARKADKLRAFLGDVHSAAAGAVVRNAQMNSNRARLERPTGTGGLPGAEWKSIFPSMAEYKAQSVGTDPAGGYLVTSDLGPYFDRLRPDSVILSAGPRIEMCDSDALEFPMLTGSVTAAHVGELGEITESNATFTKARIPMRKFATYSTGSSEWFADAAYGPRQIIEQDHRMQLGAAFDSHALQGSSSGLIQGIRQLGTATSLAAAGAAPTFDNILDAVYRMEASNARPSAIFMHPRTWNTLRKVQDGQDRYQLAPDPTQSAERRLFNLPVYLSTQISITEASANAANNDCSWIAVVDMRFVVVVRRQDVVILYDPFTLSKFDKIALRSTTRLGFNVIHTAAVEVLTGVRTS